YGKGHVEREKQEKELCLPDQALRNARDDVGEEDRKDDDAAEREDPEHGETEEGSVERGPDEFVVLQLEDWDERADECPDPVAEDAELVRENGCREEPDHHQDDRNCVVRRDVAAY